MNSIESNALPIIIAVITGVISFIGLVISKENKISEFRQAWIDELRKDISDYIALSEKHAFNYTNIWFKGKQEKSNTDYDPRAAINDFLSKESNTIDSVNTRIVLRLNPDEHVLLLNALLASYNSNISLINATEVDRRNELNHDLSKFNKELRDQSVALLRNEWKRVKKGELWFRGTKYGIQIILFILLFLYSYKVFNCSIKNNEIIDSNKVINKIDKGK